MRLTHIAWELSGIRHPEGINFDGLKMIGNIERWPAKTFKWRKVRQDLRNGGPLEMLTIAKLIKIKVLLHQFSNLMFNLHYMCLNFA